MRQGAFSIFIATALALRAAEDDLDARIKKVLSEPSIYDVEAKAFKMEPINETNVTLKNVAVFHAYNLIEFIKETGFGLTRNSAPYHTIKKEDSSNAKAVYHMTRRDLIGLVVNPKPVVYEAPSKPVSMNFMQSQFKRIDSDPKTKAPDEFESDALKKLNSGLDIVVRSSPSTVRIAGAIRARKDCVACHTCKESELLGAFSYTLLSADEMKRIAEDMLKSDSNTEESKTKLASESYSNDSAESWSRATGKSVADWKKTQFAKDDLAKQNALGKARLEGGTRYENVITTHETAIKEKKER